MSKEQARANLKADFDKDTVVDLLCDRIDELEEALKFYADEASHYNGWVDLEEGEIARTVLANGKEEVSNAVPEGQSLG